jgi:hypothetical protein
MSLELLKERFNEKPMTYQVIDQIEEKQRIIENLEAEASEFANEVATLKNEKNILLRELNKARNFEGSVFSIREKEKEKDYIDELQSKENIIKEIKSEFTPLYKKIDEQKDKLHYADDIMKKYISENKKLNEKINKLNHGLNFEKKNNKEAINETELKRKRIHQEYINNLDTYEKALISKNKIIKNYHSKLKESLDRLKEANNLIINLKKENVIKEIKNKSQLKDIEINENIRQELKEKNEKISNLDEKIHSLSKETKHLSSLSQENFMLKSKLQEAESFQNIINNKKDRFDKLLKETNNLNVFNVIKLLTTVSRKKQGNQKLTWKKWLDIPENNYLLNLDEAIAKKIFNQSNSLISLIPERIKRKSRVGSRVVRTHYGLEFNGADHQYISTTFPSDHDADPAQVDRTYSWWMKASETGRNRGVFAYGAANREGFNLNENQGTIWAGSAWRINWEGDFHDDNTWHHWMVFNNTDEIQNSKLYIDGELKTLTTENHSGAPMDHTDPLTIGAATAGSAQDYQYFTGSITNFAVFSNDVTDRVVSHYNNGVPKNLTSEAGLEGYWPMAEGSGITVKDHSGHGNDGTTTNDPTWTTLMKETDHMVDGITYMEHLTTGEIVPAYLN